MWFLPGLRYCTSSEIPASRFGSRVNSLLDERVPVGEVRMARAVWSYLQDSIVQYVQFLGTLSMMQVNLEKYGKSSMTTTFPFRKYDFQERANDAS